PENSIFKNILPKLKNDQKLIGAFFEAMEERAFLKWVLSDASIKLDTLRISKTMKEKVLAAYLSGSISQQDDELLAKTFFSALRKGIPDYVSQADITHARENLPGGTIGGVKREFLKRLNEKKDTPPETFAAVLELLVNDVINKSEFDDTIGDETHGVNMPALNELLSAA
ncbi:MAG: hypothetical protein ABSH12_09460, partial [Endomicrobiales bacterium]